MWTPRHLPSAPFAGWSCRRSVAWLAWPCRSETWGNWQVWDATWYKWFDSDPVGDAKRMVMSSSWSKMSMRKGCDGMLMDNQTLCSNLKWCAIFPDYCNLYVEAKHLHGFTLWQLRLYSFVVWKPLSHTFNSCMCFLVWTNKRGTITLNLSGITMYDHAKPTKFDGLDGPATSASFRLSPSCAVTDEESLTLLCALRADAQKKLSQDWQALKMLAETGIRAIIWAREVPLWDERSI